MAGYNFEPVWVPQLVAVVVYLVSIFFMVCTVLGIFRVMAVKLPLRTDKNGEIMKMFLLDFWPMLRQTDGPERKSFKCMVLAIIAMIAATCWFAVITVTSSVGDKLFGWTLASEELVAGFHTVLMFLLLIGAAKRGWRGARNFEMNKRRSSWES